jgi:hypothetical protein
LGRGLTTPHRKKYMNKMLHRKLEILKGGAHLEDLDIDDKIILK